MSHHLLQLKVSRLIEFRREGKFNYYRLNETGLMSALEELTAETGGKFLLGGIEVSIRRK